MSVIIEHAEPWEDGTLARAWFDETRRYRYMLERDFRSTAFDMLAFPERQQLKGTVTWLMLNPSTANAFVDDRTVARCSDFAKRWGFKRLLVVNLFALRSTDPKVLRSTPDAEGDPENLAMIGRAIHDSEIAVCAWGTHGAVRQRGTYIREVLMGSSHADKLRCLGTTKEGYPLHPLYQRADTELIPFGRTY